MPKITLKPQLDVQIHLTLNEAEARALDALIGYGDDAFFKAFAEKLGEHYMKPHEQACRQFFKEARPLLIGALAQLDAARSVFSK